MSDVTLSPKELLDAMYRMPLVDIEREMTRLRGVSEEGQRADEALTMWAKIRDARRRGDAADVAPPQVPTASQAPDVAPVPPNGHRPTLRNAVVTVMATDPPHDWTPTELRKELLKRDWLTASAQNRIFEALRHLIERGQVQRQGTGVYRLAATTPDLIMEGGSAR